MLCPLTVTAPLKINFFYLTTTYIQNITTLNYQLIQYSSAFNTLVVANSDIVTNILTTSAYVNNAYSFIMNAYDKQANAVSVTLS